jgi:hypothetical protein
MVKSFRVIGTSAVFLLLGWTVPADSRQEQQDQQAKPPKQEQQAKPEKQQQAKGQQDQQRQQRQQQDNSAKQQQQQAKAPQQRQQAKPEKQQQAKGQQDQQRQQRQQQDNSAKQQQQQAKGQQDQQRQQQVAWQGDRAHSWQSEHRTWQQRGGYNGYRVPDDRFRGYYGQDHGFRIYSLPVMYVGGHRRFQYGGYWFGLVDPWPEYWSSNWYDNDDVYVDYYGDGYYLYNRRYPGDRIAISFYLN